MASYPTTPPTNKHDLLCTDPPPATSSTPSLEDFSNLVSSLKFSSSAELVHKVSDHLQPPHLKPFQIASVYSYEDGPEYPGPLSRSLLILGIADRSLAAIRNIVDSDAALPDGMHQCTLAVQLADARHFGRLEGRHQKNSTQFARFMVALRKSKSVAILGKDKFQRFGILVPLTKDEGHGEEQFTANDFAAQCYIGDWEEVKTLLMKGKMEDTPVKSSNTPWENNGSDQDEMDGPTYEPGDDDGGWKPSTPPIPPGDDDGGWKPTTPPLPPGGDSDGFSAPWDTSGGDNDDHDAETNMPWETSQDDSQQDGEGNGSAAMPWEVQGNQDNGSASGSSGALPWETGDNANSNKRSFDEMNGDGHDSDDNSTDADQFHKNKGAAEADAFYSGLTRSLDTRADSYLYHMRSFNGWVKATQIAELDPIVIVNGQPQPKEKLRVLDLACGKGGDLNKWVLHPRGMRHYVGIDVARGSLKDAAERARGMRQKKKLDNAIFSCADLGSDVPGRKRTPNSKSLQKLLTWKLEDEALYESGEPEFEMERGGGISETDKFDVVSIQFAIHYMMQTRERARRFFHTVSQLLEVGGLLAFTTIDARVILDHIMNLGLDLHFDDDNEPEFSEVVVEAGSGACKIKFEPKIVKKLMNAVSGGSKAEEELFGLEYTFTLVEGSDHKAGVGDAVNLPEWLTPIPVLEALAKEAGLELDYVQNFHEFYHSRKDPSEHPQAHQALQNMKVVNRNGSMSKEEWSISRLYAAMTFRKVRESSVVIGDEGEVEEEEDDDEEEKEASSIQLDPMKLKALYPRAMMLAKKEAGDEWNSFSREKKERLTQAKLRQMAAA
jgi:mRNA (guanine-N7-)-methyltransferase